MSKKHRFDWATIRAEYEAGANQSAVAGKYGVSRAAVQKHIAKEGWTQDPEPALHRLVAQKVAGLVAPCDPIKKAAALDAEAERRAAVVSKHREEWQGSRELTIAARKALDFELAKLAKITTETLAIIQAGERKAWGLDRDVNEGKLTVVIERESLG